MQLTVFTDYALRTLLYAQAAGDRLVTIAEIADALGVSRAHLMKVVNGLTRRGYLTAVRGRSGGLRLARDGGAILLGDLVRDTEPDFALVQCFGAREGCSLAGACRLPAALEEGLEAFIAALNRHSLASVGLTALDFSNLPKGSAK